MFTFMEEIEKWKSIVGFKGFYQVSNTGKVRNIITNKILKTGNGIDNKYCQVSLISPKRKKRILVHRLVAQAFLRNPERKTEVNHKNLIKSDNRVENLEWVTHAENLKHAYLNGFKAASLEKHGRAKITRHDVINIRRRYKAGESAKDLSKEYNIGYNYVFCVINKKTWKSI